MGDLCKLSRFVETMKLEKMSGEKTIPTTQCRRRTRNNNEILCQPLVANYMTLRRKTTTKRAPKHESWLALTLLVLCWTFQVTQAIPLLNGRYETTTDVTDYLNLALDVSKMSDSEDFDNSMDIYKNVSLPFVPLRFDCRS